MFEGRETALAVRKARIRKDRARYMLNFFTLRSKHKLNPADVPCLQQCREFCPQLLDLKSDIYGVIQQFDQFLKRDQFSEKENCLILHAFSIPLKENFKKYVDEKASSYLLKCSARLVHLFAACLQSTVRYELICCLELIADIALAFEHAEELEVFVEKVDLVPRLAAILKSKQVSAEISEVCLWCLLNIGKTDLTRLLIFQEADIFCACVDSIIAQREINADHISTSFLSKAIWALRPLSLLPQGAEEESKIEQFLRNQYRSLFKIVERDPSYDLVLDFLDSLVVFTNRPSRCELLLTTKYLEFLTQQLSHYELRIKEAAAKVFVEFFTHTDEGLLMRALQMTEALDSFLKTLISFKDIEPRPTIIKALMALVLRGVDEVLLHFAAQKGGLITLAAFMTHQLHQINPVALFQGLYLVKAFYDISHLRLEATHFFELAMLILQLPEFRLNMDLIVQTLDFVGLILYNADPSLQEAYCKVLQKSNIDIEEAIFYWTTSHHTPVAKAAGRVLRQLSELAKIYYLDKDAAAPYAPQVDIEL